MFVKKAWEYSSQAKQFMDYYGRNDIKVLAVHISGGLCVLDIVYGIDDLVIVRGYIGDLHKYKIKYNTAGRAYFKYCNGCRYFLDDFMRMSA